MPLIWDHLLEWLREHLLTCPSKYLFHIDCPGCGLQRSIMALLEGDIIKSFTLYPATLPIILLLTYTLLHIKVSFRNGASIIKWGYIGCTVIILGFYIFKITTHKIFSL